MGKKKDQKRLEKELRKQAKRDRKELNLPGKPRGSVDGFNPGQPFDRFCKIIDKKERVIEIREWKSKSQQGDSQRINRMRTDHGLPKAELRF